MILEMAGANNRIERTGTGVPAWHAPGVRQSRARRPWETPPLIRALGLKTLDAQRPETWRRTSTAPGSRENTRSRQ